MASLSAMIRERGPKAASWRVLCVLVVVACEGGVDGDDPLGVVEARPGDIYPPPYAVPGRWTFQDPVCGGDQELIKQFEIEAPTPPQDYHLTCCDAQPVPCPDTICVSNAAELEAAAHLTTKKTIILDDGYYLGADLTVENFLRLKAGHRLWAKNSGEAILTFGVYIGAVGDQARYSGAEFHGLVFDINDPQYGAPIDNCGVKKGALVNYGVTRDLRVEDCWFRGWDAIHVGIRAAQPNGLEIHRVEIFNFLRFGILEELPSTQTIEDPAVITDVAVRNIGDLAWESQSYASCPKFACDDPNDLDPYCPGTSEHGIWLGETATLKRARVRNVRSAGVISGDNVKRVADHKISDIDVDDVGANPHHTGAGIAFERGNDDPEVRRFCLGRGMERGIHAEWDQGFPHTRSRGIHVVDGFTKASKAGIHFDAGTTDNLVENVRVLGASWSALGFHKNYLTGGGSTANTTVWCDVVTSNQPSGACEVTFTHYNTSPAVCQPNVNHPSCPP